jgi:FkbM family methyltransferase
MSNFLREVSNKIEIVGIIQAGANVGQETKIFQQFTNNIICFEPVTNVFETLKKNNPNILCFNFGLGEKNEIKKMYLSSNNYESSSFLEPKNHKTLYDVKFNREELFEIKRFDSLNITPEKYNVLVSDTQGYEIKVLEGFGKYLNNIECVIIEYINSNLYDGDSNLEAITKFLKNWDFGLFQAIDVENGWGNACFLKKNKL